MAVPENPHTLLIPDDRPKSIVDGKWISAVLGFVGFGTGGCANLGRSKPFFSGIQQHIIYTVVGVIAGKFISDRRQAYLADRDAVFRHYIELHPDDFPVPERKYLKDIFKPWHPVR